MAGQLNRLRDSRPKPKIDLTPKEIGLGVDTGGRCSPEEIAGVRLYLTLRCLRGELSKEAVEELRDILGIKPGTKWYGSVSSSDVIEQVG